MTSTCKYADVSVVYKFQGFLENCVDDADLGQYLTIDKVIVLNY